MKETILAITQCFPCGSWLSIEKITNMLSEENNQLIILGYGSPVSKRKDQKYVLIPYLPYNRFGNITCYSPIIGFIWDFPLFIASILSTIIFRPKIVIYNGLGLGLTLSPLFKSFGIKNVIMYHSTIKNTDPNTKKYIKFLFKFVDLVVVNSIGSKQDLGDTLTNKKIVINEHYASDLYFKQGKRKPKSHKKLRILYVGRIDKDKLCFPLLKFAELNKGDGDYEFTFVGAGSGVEKIISLSKKYPKIKYLGYIGDIKILSNLYRSADVVWSFADTTYLALPAVEALASDTPIIIPKYAALHGSKELINANLVPKDIGWIIDTDSEDEIMELMERIRLKKEYINKNCYDYAKQHYSSVNLTKTIKQIGKIIEVK